MSLIDKVRGILFTNQAADGDAPTTGLHVIDTSRLGDNSGGRERLSPRDQFALLQRLARFAEKESIKLCALIEGRPLREVADRETYEDVKVYYIDDGDKLEDIVLLAIREGGNTRDALVVTGDRKLEQALTTRGIQTMRTSTFRKALEEKDGGRSDRNGGGGGGNRRRRRPRPRRPEGEGRPSQNQNQNQKPKEDNPNPQQSSQKDDGVSDLIDLV